MSDEFNTITNEEAAQEDFHASSAFSAESMNSEFHSTPSQKKSRSRAVKITALALSCALLGGIGGIGAASLFNKNGSGSSSSSVIYQGAPHNAVTLAAVDSSTVLSDAEIYAANVNSTVGITTSVTTNYWGYTTTSAAAGSGFIITSDGYIVTNYHVVEDSNSITVTLYNNESYDAELVGYDENNDVAVLKIDANDLTPVVIGDSSALRVGDHVVAIGNPLGELTFSLTQGAVSALNREVTFSSGLRMALIQTDCSINSGNSGGALFNCYGELIGITNAKYGSSSSSGASIDNIGFAIPFNSVKQIVSSIIEKGYIEKPYIGITIMTVSEDVRAYGLPAGASVQSVVEGSPAEAAGLQANDIITEADGNAISSSSDLTSYVSSKAPDDVIELTVYRSGETLHISVTVGLKQESAMANEDAAQEQTESESYQDQEGLEDWSDFFSQNMPGFYYQH